LGAAGVASGGVACNLGALEVEGWPAQQSAWKEFRLVRANPVVGLGCDDADEAQGTRLDWLTIQQKVSIRCIQGSMTEEERVDGVESVSRWEAMRERQDR
jgi:hypothetical protein